MSGGVGGSRGAIPVTRPDRSELPTPSCSVLLYVKTDIHTRCLKAVEKTVGKLKKARKKALCSKVLHF
jgi:hypothetical protein